MVTIGRGGSRMCGKGGGRSGYRERRRREGFWRIPFEDPLWNFKRGGHPLRPPPLNPLVIGIEVYPPPWNSVIPPPLTIPGYGAEAGPAPPPRLAPGGLAPPPAPPPPSLRHCTEGRRASRCFKIWLGKRAGKTSVSLYIYTRDHVITQP